MASPLATPVSSLSLITRWGWRELALYGAPLLAAGVLLWVTLHPAAAVIPALGLAFLVSFFRDPRRIAPEDPEIVVSPADGRVTAVERLDPGHELAAGMGEPVLRISIFLSVFDVHVNRSPIAGRVTDIQYRPGRFLDARDPRCAKENEANRITISPHASPDTPVTVLQVSGAIARRIVCPIHVGQDLGRAERFGMIKFGSRTDLLMPLRLAPEPLVKPGDRVKGGSTPMARLPGIETTAGPRECQAEPGSQPVSTGPEEPTGSESPASTRSP